jgi:hypothetical protein
MFGVQSRFFAAGAQLPLPSHFGALYEVPAVHDFWPQFLLDGATAHWPCPLHVPFLPQSG